MTGKAGQKSGRARAGTAAKKGRRCPAVRDCRKKYKNVCTGGHAPAGTDTYKEIWRQIVCEMQSIKCAICRQILSRGCPRGGTEPLGNRRAGLFPLLQRVEFLDTLRPPVPGGPDAAGVTPAGSIFRCSLPQRPRHRRIRPDPHRPAGAFRRWNGRRKYAGSAPPCRSSPGCGTWDR